jgi:hypothetical protein
MGGLEMSKVNKDDAKNVSWVSPSGNEVSLELHYVSWYFGPSDIDGGWEGKAKESYLVEKYTIIYINGEKKGRVDKIWELNDETLKEAGKMGSLGVQIKKMSEAGATHYSVIHGADIIQPVGFIGYPAKSVEIAWNELEMNEDPEVKRLRNKEKEKEKLRKINDANRILGKVSRTKAIFNGKIPSRKMAVSWRKQYNDFHNEGGEGYIPQIVTVEEVEWAEMIMKNESGNTSKYPPANIEEIGMKYSYEPYQKGDECLD